MRYMMLLRLDPAKAPADGPGEELMSEMGKLLEEMTKAGVLLDTGGLRPAESGAVIRQAGGKQTVLDGPFAEAKEVIGGYRLPGLGYVMPRHRRRGRRSAPGS